MIVDFNKAPCTTKMKIGPAPTFWIHFVIDICIFGN
jgi:hypothetical protein